MADRLKIVIGNRSNSEFARSISVREGTVRSWLNGGNLPGAEALVEIQRVHGCSIDWILTGRGSQKIDEYRSQENSPAQSTVAVLRFHVAASAGFGAYSAGASPTDVVELPRQVLDRVGCKPATARILDAAGSSMEPTIGDGDLLLVDVAKERRIPIDGRIYVLSVGEGLFVKRLRRTTKGWTMSSDNRALFPDEPIPEGCAVTIHGQVVWTGRQLP